MTFAARETSPLVDPRECRNDVSPPAASAYVSSSYTPIRRSSNNNARGNNRNNNSQNNSINSNNNCNYNNNNHNDQSPGTIARKFGMRKKGHGEHFIVSLTIDYIVLLC